MFEVLTDLRLALQARFASYWRRREIVRVALTMQMHDLATTPVHLHAALRAQHAVELREIRAGRLAFLDRRTAINTGIPFSMTRINTPVPKNAPLSLRQFSRTPVPARAINIIKGGLLGLAWDIVPIEGKAAADDPDVKARIQIAKNVFEKPNDTDSFREWTEMLLTDFLVYGMGAAELKLNPADDRPVMMWAFDASTLNIVPEWKEEIADRMPRYAQVMPFSATQTEPLLLMDDEVLAIRDNIATDTPFGTGSLEIAYRAVKDLLGVQQMAGLAGSDQMGRQIFWWSGALPPATIKDMRDYLQAEIEGMARVGMIGGAPKPEVVPITPVAIDDLLLPWQEMLIRMIANSFNMSGMSLNIERDVNRSTGEVLDDKDFRTAVVPPAKRFQEALTRRVIHKAMGWDDIKFVFLGTEDPDIETKLEILTARYSSNACTGNDMNRALGIKPIDSPFADLTSFELILIQAAMQQMLKPPPQPGMGANPADPNNPQNQGPSNGLADNSNSGVPQQPKAPASPTIKQPQQPKLTAPKMPKLKQFSAEQISGMSIAMIRALQTTGVLPQSGIQIAQDMREEQPDVLKELSEQVWDYLDTLAEREIKNAKTDSKKAKLNKKWNGLAKVRYGRSAARLRKLSQASLNVHGASTQQTVKPFYTVRRKGKLSY